MPKAKIPFTSRYLYNVILASGLSFCALLLSACSDSSEQADAKVAAQPQVASAPAKSYMKITKVERKYDFVRQDLEDAITGKGIVISGISHISDMLKRTGKDLGATQEIFAHAEAINFCSASISRNMMQVDPTNIVFCPYILTIYSLPDEPDITYIAYRTVPELPTAESTQALQAVENLLQGIIDEVAM